MCELTVTISPCVEQDFDLVSFATDFSKQDLPFIVAKHSETGHVNFHIYFRHDKKVRSDNFRRKFYKYIGGDSIPSIAIKVTNAYSLQSFINYVFHEESVQLLLRHKIKVEEIDNCIESKTVSHALPKQSKVLTMKNASGIITDFCRTNDIKPFDYAGSRLLVKLMLQHGYTFAPVRGKLTQIMSEVKYKMSGDDKYIFELINEINQVEQRPINF